MSFFTVKYGGTITYANDNDNALPFIFDPRFAVFQENEERLFNTNVLNVVLLNHIKSSLALDFPEAVDLATDAGEVLDLLSKPKEYARKSIEPRSICTLIKVMYDEADGSPMYVPLVENSAGAEKIKLTARRAPNKRHVQAANYAGGQSSIDEGETTRISSASQRAPKKETATGTKVGRASGQAPGPTMPMPAQARSRASTVTRPSA